MKPITYEDKMKDRNKEFLYNKCVEQYHCIINYQSQMCEYKIRIKELEAKLNKLKEDTPKENKRIPRVSLLDVKTDYKLKDILNEIINKINGE